MTLNRAHRNYWSWTKQRLSMLNAKGQIRFWSTLRHQLK